MSRVTVRPFGRVTRSTVTVKIRPLKASVEDSLVPQRFGGHLPYSHPNAAHRWDRGFGPEQPSSASVDSGRIARGTFTFFQRNLQDWALHGLG